MDAAVKQARASWAAAGHDGPAQVDGNPLAEAWREEFDPGQLAEAVLTLLGPGVCEYLAPGLGGGEGAA